MKLINSIFQRIGRLLGISRPAAPPVEVIVVEASSEEESKTEMPEFTERRRFLNQVSIGLSGLLGIVLATPVLGFVFGPRRDEIETVWRPIGALDDFPIGRTVRATFLDPSPLPWAGYAAQSAAYVRQESEGQFIALSVYCTHVGCPIWWTEESQIFMCPCHGGSFFRDGAVAGGPPRLPLERYEIRVRDGQVEILARPQPLPT
ncbi:MAG: Rieske 2Fe-2S domain-containing protein [Caldilineaceae bacterium]|nr:Rieske 2Fe-2S domain-containing protein [Caldilineaceae bacterium]